MFKLFRYVGMVLMIFPALGNLACNQGPRTKEIYSIDRKTSFTVPSGWEEEKDAEVFPSNFGLDHEFAVCEKRGDAARNCAAFC